MAVPPETPAISPVEGLIVATEVLSLLQVPPVAVSLNVLEVPLQIVVVPVMAVRTGIASTVIEAVVKADPQADIV